MEKVIEFKWWNDSDIYKNHCDILEGHAIEHIFEMLQLGYRCGELHEEIGGEVYKGWWNYK